MEYLLAFHSTHKALKAESLLKHANICFRLLPGPKEVAAYCALVIRVMDDVLTKALAELKDSGAEPVAIYIKEDDHYVEM